MQDAQPASSAGTPVLGARASAPSPRVVEPPKAPIGNAFTGARVGRGTNPACERPDSALPETQSGLAAQIDQLARGGQLDGLQTAYLRDRWLDQATWLDRRAGQNQRRHYALRLITILGGVAIPALVGLELNNEAAKDVRWLTFGLGLLVAAAAALEEFFRYGERWRHYRRHAELLKAEGWAFLQFVGPAYTSFATHAEAFRTFVSRVEDTMRQEVGVYIADVTRAPEQEGRTDKGGSSFTAAISSAGEGPSTAATEVSQ